MMGVESVERSNNANATNSNIASGVAGRNMMSTCQRVPTLEDRIDKGYIISRRQNVVFKGKKGGWES